MAQPVNDAADCAASFRFAEKPVPVVKTSDGQTVLASVEWGYSAEHNLCYLVLDNQAVTVLRAKRDEIIGTDPPQDAAAAARCHRAYNPQRGFAADPVPVVKTADGQTVLATVRWGYSSEHNLCYLVLDDQAITILQTAAAAVAQERYEERLAAAVETLDDGAVCPQADAPESFDGVAEVGRIQDGCVVLEYVALAGRTMADLRAELASDPTVFAVGFPVIDVVPLQTPSGLYDDPSLPQWHLETMGADKLWDPDGWDYTDDQGNKRRIPGWPAGAEVTVAVIDSGVDGGHRDLDANVLTTGHECNRIDEEGDHGHGTLVAGIIAAEQGNGVDVAGIAPKARILPIRIDRLDKNCKDDLFPTVTQAINDARTSGADIINISLHWPLEESDGTTRIILDCAPGPGGRTQRIPLGPSAYCVSTDTMWWAIRVARRQGVVTVAASGNCGDDHPEEWADPDGDGRRDWVRSADKDNPKGDYDKSEWKYAWENDGCDRHNQFDYPASYPETISVAAINADRQRRVSSTSNGSVDVAAPGGKILTTRSRLPRYEEAGGTVTRSGTSFAAPMVSAAIAHMKARYPQATPEQITTAILATAHQDPNANPRSFNTALLHLGFRTDDLGYGIINPIAAIEYLDRRLNHLPTPTTGNQFTAIATGSEHSCAIKTDKSIACWGSDNVHETAPPLGQFTAITAGGELSCAIKTNKSIACWGSNFFGLANAPAGQFTAITQSCAIKTDKTIACWGSHIIDEAAPPEGQFTAIDAGQGYWCAIKTDKTITCWGSNSGSVIDPPEGQFTAIAAGSHHACAIRANGSITCWGSNRAGQIDRTGATDAPDGQFTAIDADQHYSCAIKTDKTITCWGLNTFGQTDAPLGRFTAIAVGPWHSCAINTDKTIKCWGLNNSGQTDASAPSLATANAYTTITAGSEHSCAINTDKTIACWGLRFNSDYGETDAPSGQFTTIAAGDEHSCAINADKAIACWGDNRRGQIDSPSGQFTAIATGPWHSCAIKSDKTITCWGWEYADPTDAPDGQFTAIAAGFGHSCAIRTDKTITCWGRTEIGQINSPSGQFTAIATGIDHSCAIRTDKTIICWGGNFEGQIDSPPGQFTAIAAGNHHSCAITANGTITCWGDNRQGQIDSPPGQFTAIAAGNHHSCAITTNGTVTCWGRLSFRTV